MDPGLRRDDIAYRDVFPFTLSKLTLSEHREAGGAGTPSLANLILNWKAGGGECRMRRTGDGFRVADDAHQMIDCRLFAAMPHFYKVPGRAGSFHGFLPTDARHCVALFYDAVQIGH